jgi:hypothetical protein
MDAPLMMSIICIRWASRKAQGTKNFFYSKI